MPESGLAVTYATLRSELGYTLGYGRTSSAWTSDQSSELASCLDAMLRRVYYHATSAATAGTPHRWSFLRSTVRIHTVDGSADVLLPEDVGEIIPPITFAPESFYRPVAIVDDGIVRMREQSDQTSGWPRICSINVDKPDGSIPTRTRLRFWPTPDAAYGLDFKAEVKIDQLSSTRPYPPGGVKMSEVLLSACRAAKEILIDDAPGSHTADFNRLLADAIRADQSASTPKRIGVVGNPDVGCGAWRDEAYRLPTVTFS